MTAHIGFRHWLTMALGIVMVVYCVAHLVSLRGKRSLGAKAERLQSAGLLAGVPLAAAAIFSDLLGDGILLAASLVSGGPALSLMWRAHRLRRRSTETE